MKKAVLQSSPTVVACVAIALGLTLAYAVSGAIIRPSMYSDSGWGFFGWDRRHGLPFNYGAYPDPSNFAKDAFGFLGWWSPGQHVLPGLVEEMGLDLGLSIIVVTTAFSLLGLAGWFTLYRSFGFPAGSSAIAVAIVACTRHFALPFGVYNGGEVLLFGIAPWFLMLVWRLRELRWTVVLPLVAGAAVMTFAKLSGILIAACAIGAVAGSPGRWFSKETIRRGFVAAVTILLIGVTFYFVWFSRSATPVSDGAMQEGGWLDILRQVVFTLGATWSAALSFGDLASYIALHPSRPLLPSLFPVHCGFLLFAVAIFAFVWWRLRDSHADYLRFSVLLWGSVAIVLTVVSAKGGAVGADERHMRIVSLVLFGGIVHSVVSAPNTWVRSTFSVAALVVVAYGVSSYVAHGAWNLKRPLGDRGFRHQIADAAVLDFIHGIDAAQADRFSTFIYVTSPEIALEARNVRGGSNHADFQTPETLSQIKLRGLVPKLYIIVPKRLVDSGKAAVMLHSFVDYPESAWREIPVGGSVVFFSDFGARRGS